MIYILDYIVSYVIFRVVITNFTPIDIAINSSFILYNV